VAQSKGKEETTFYSYGKGTKESLILRFSLGGYYLWLNFWKQPSDKPSNYVHLSLTSLRLYCLPVWESKYWIGMESSPQ
jgi:hypothetical protein